MTFGIKLGELAIEDFTVTNQTGDLISNIPLNEFTWNLFDSSDSTSSISIQFVELGNGHYRSKFIPDLIGTWYLVIYHSTYFPYGKQGSIKVYINDIDTIGSKIDRILGLVQENYYLDEIVNNDDNNMISGRIRIYSNSTSVGTNSDIISTYNITADWTGTKMNWYKVIKV